MEKTDLTRNNGSEFVHLDQEQFAALMETLFLMDAVHEDVLRRVYIYRQSAFQVTQEEDTYNIELI